ncbi:MAG TPA: penicillin-binding transpeptidase domain-containing protein, partial [Nitrososphaera sp.]|nr:penicillin-binding transpeptidase domain-containing protein [Nitrososphaera sp.]
LGSPTGIFGMSEPAGTIPTPEWKAKNFNGDPWRVGDTYNTSIGQYGVQVTPLQAVRAIATIANGGSLLTPTLLASSSPHVATTINFPEHYFDVVREGMHMSVEQGTAIAVNLPFIEIGGKTGTAQTGVHNEFINSWTVGFFPYDNPKYAYAVVLERGPANATVGATPAMSQFFWWLNEHAPQYLK